jgi:hypothetical protein
MTVLAAAAVLSLSGVSDAQSPGPAYLLLSPSDLRIEQRGDSGYHLYVRRKPGIGSVLLTETTKDPAGKADNYAYRAKEANPINGDEKRMLNGAFIPAESKLYSLIDSTPETDPALGECFHVFIPYVVVFGYQGGRSGEVFVADGTFINVRTFAKPYADYSGAWADNPFQVKVTQKPLPGPPEGNYLKDAEEDFKRLSGDGKVVYSSGEKDIMPKIEAVLARDPGKDLDLVLCLDTTESMANDMAELKKSLTPMLERALAGHPSHRIGLVYYKDYFEEYVVRRFEFTANLTEIQKRIDSLRALGGRDIPEAVNEALYAALTEYPWAAEKRRIILVGDAPAHPIPRGDVDEEDVRREAARLGVEITAIILPQ